MLLLRPCACVGTVSTDALSSLGDRYPEACLFALGGQDATLLMPQGPSLHHLSARPLRSQAGRWLETCRWVSVTDHPEGKSKLGTSLELSWLIADIVLTFGHQIFDDAPIGFVSQYAKIVLQIKFLLRSSYPEEELGDKNMSLLEACQTSRDFPLRGRPDTWDMGAFKNFLSANFGALKRCFSAITTACSTGPTFGVCVFVTSRASGFVQPHHSPVDHSHTTLSGWSWRL